jgi:hypothetical protein
MPSDIAPAIMQSYYTLLKGFVVIIVLRIGNGWINNFFSSVGDSIPLRVVLKKYIFIRK